MGFTRHRFACERDGLVLRGMEFRPVQGASVEGASAEGASAQDASAHLSRLPVAILSHGFMANQRTVHPYAKALARAGRAAFCFDFAGGCVLGGRSDGKTTDMSVRTEARDLAAVLAYVRGLPHIDADDVLLLGCSQGGLVSALVAAEHPDDVAKLALFYPALCIPDDARAGKMMFARFDPSNVPERFWCGPMRLGRRYAEDVMGMDPFAEIAGYGGPVLIVHGSADRVVDVGYARRALAAYQARPAGSDGAACAELVVLEGAGHGFVGRSDALATKALIEFAARPPVR